MKAVQKNVWFEKVRGSYLPTSWQGRVIYLAYVVYIVAVPATWYKNGHDFWTLLVSVIPLMTAAALVAHFIASKTSK